MTKKTDTPEPVASIDSADHAGSDNVLDLERFRGEVEQPATIGSAQATSEQGQKTELISEKEINLANELAHYLAIFFGFIRAPFPRVGEIYTGEVINVLGQEIAAVAVARGWFKEGIGGKYKKELRLIGTVAGLGMITYPAAIADYADLKAKFGPSKPDETEKLAESLQGVFEKNAAS